MAKLYQTSGIYKAIEDDFRFGNEIDDCLRKYTQMDWGQTCKDDCHINNESVDCGERVVALYRTSKGKVFIITERDRSATTILFASEY